MYLLAVAVIAAAVLAGCQKEPKPSGNNGGGGGSTTIAVTGVSLNKTSITLEEGGSESLTAAVAPTNATNKAVSWKSSDTGVATVDGNGKVTAVKAGSATITVTTTDGSKTATCTVTVTAAATVVEVSDVSLDKAELELVKGDSYQFTVTLKPDDATDKSLSWSSSDDSIVSVDASGKVTALSAGNATVTVKTSNPSQSASCAVTVLPETVSVTGININNWTINLPPGGTDVINYTIQPEDATNKAVTFSSDNTDVVAVDSQGTVIGVSAGSAKVTVTTEDGGFSSSCTVNVVGSAGTIEVGGFFFRDYGFMSLEVIADPSGQKKWSGDITIPGKVTYNGIEYTVENIGDRAFIGNVDLKSVTIESGVKEIDAYAFSGCENLEKIVFPATLVDYNNSNDVFGSCPKLEIEVDPANEFFYVKDHGLYQKRGGKRLLRWIPEKLTGSFTVEDGTTDIERYSVYHTSIDKLVLPASITFIYERFLCGECKTPLVIELNWTTINEINRIAKTYDDPSPFFLNGTDRSKITVSVPAGTKAFYQAHWLWGACGSIVER